MLVLWVVVWGEVFVYVEVGVDLFIGYVDDEVFECFGFVVGEFVEVYC